MSAPRYPVATVVLLSMLAAGCGGSDATAPRAVREIKPASPPPAAVPAAQEALSPTRGLPCRVQTGSMRLCGASTDNYKASFNAAPDAPEQRTWLAINELELNGDRFEVVAGQVLQPDAVRLRPVGEEDATELRVTAELVSGPATVRLRVGPQLGLWGPLVTLDDDQIADGDTVVVKLQVVDGPDEAAVQLEYVRDNALAAAQEGSLEHGGPGGRWQVAGTATATNLELGWE